MTASSPLSLPSLIPDLSSLFTSDTLASFGSSPAAYWASEQELRINLNGTVDSALVQASMSRMSSHLSRATTTKSSPTPFQILSNGWRVRNFPDQLQATLSSDLEMYGISIVYPTLPPASSSSSSTGSGCAADDVACLNGGNTDTTVSSSSFLSSTEDKVGLGVGVGAGVILIATLIACVWWGRHSASPHKRKFTASSRNLELYGANTEVTPGSPSSKSSMSGSSPRLDPMSAAFEHFPSPSSPRLSSNRRGADRSPSRLGLDGDSKEGEIVLHVIPEAEEEISRSTRPGSKVGHGGAGGATGRFAPTDTTDGLDLGEVILSPHTPDSRTAGEDGPAPSIPSPLMLGARAPSFDVGSLPETDDIDELKKQMHLLQEQIEERRRRERKEAEKLAKVQQEQMTEKQKKESAAAAAAGSLHDAPLNNDLSAAFASAAGIEMQLIASARGAPPSKDTRSDAPPQSSPSSAAENDSTRSSTAAISVSTDPDQPIQHASLPSPSMFALDSASSPSTLASLAPPTRQPSLMSLDERGSTSDSLRTEVKELGRKPSDSSSLAAPSADHSRINSLSVGYDTPGPSRPGSLAPTLGGEESANRRDSLQLTGMISVKTPLIHSTSASNSEPSPSRSPSSSQVSPLLSLHLVLHHTSE